MNRKIYSFAMVALLTVLFGCYPGGADYVEEYDVTYTNYDKTYDFVTPSTYSLPDKIVKITGDLIQVKPPNPPTTPEYIKDAYAGPILAQIDANMQRLGWTKVDINVTTPDVQLLPAAWESTTIIYGGYWGGYWCWYYPYYCGGGWYYPYVPVTTYSTGTLVMTMVDPKTETADDSKHVVWTGAINGLLSGKYSTDRVNKGIDQAFTQSPYLKTN